MFEALEFISYVRFTVLGPLLHIKNGNLPKGVRKIETQVDPVDLGRLKATIAAYDKQSLMNALEASVETYRYLRQQLFDLDIVQLQTKTEEKVLEYLQEIRSQLLTDE